ncbi:MAG: proteasome assembly chaperone family protein [Candidatus Aenigmatarchaeota archaeon]|nr:proteasome assembly chaperone family protein [Candidatus Aenigmarchaeota archaeon]
MIETIYLEEPKLNNVIMIEGLPGIGNIGRIAAGYLVEKLKAKNFAELYSSDFFPSVILQKDGIARLLRIEFYYYKGEKNDLIIVIGDTQASTPEGYYDLSNAILDVARKFDVNLIITLGGLAREEFSGKPRVVGAVNNEKLLERFKNYEIIFDGNLVGSIVGVSGLLVGLAAIRGIDAISLLAETTGFPIVIADPIGAEAVLRVLMKILDIEIDLSELEKEARELEKKIKKTEEFQKRMIKEILSAKEENKEVSYIG